MLYLKHSAGYFKHLGLCLFGYYFCNCLVSVSPHTEKFNKASNDHGRTHMCDFSVFVGIYPFLANFVKKIKIVSLSWILVPRLIRICRIEWWCSLFPVLTGNTLFGKIWTKSQNCQFKIKFGTCTNSNTQSLMVVFTFSILDRISPFWANLFQKIKVVSLIWNLVPRLIRICRIQ